MNSKSVMIKAENVYKTYGKGDSSVHALNGISFSVAQGDMIAIVGPSGSGKSTLLNILGLLDSKTSGQLSICDKDVGTMNEKVKAKMRNEKIGFVVQDFALIEKYTVLQNIKIPLTYSSKKTSKADRDHAATSILRDLGILEKRNALASNLSGGQRQRVSIARALINNPDIILADEPTGSLDSKTAMEIMNILKDLNQKGKTILVITHDPKIADCCNTRITISDGVMSSPL